jgi:glycine cleavage system H protein
VNPNPKPQLSAVSPEKLLYAKTHEWVHLETDSKGRKVATVGISSFAVESLTDLVFMQLPEVGRNLKAGDSFGEIESVKAVSDLYSPVDGEVIAVNQQLPNKLETLNSDPFGQGWLVKIKLTSEDGLRNLLDYAAYQKQCAEEQH